ncbi:MAG: hypothetical protein EGQ20_07270 [Bacteroides oleiciplenus]|nr:hypothetical protein [Bacteroides oleiciplenus]
MKIIKLFLFLTITLFVGACSEDALDSQSIFSTEAPERNGFDTWLLKNYVNPYNIAFNYRYDDKESNNDYNLAPAEYDKSIALAIMMKHVWMDTYAELAGEDFVKSYCPRVMQLIGSPAFNSKGEVVQGTAEGGLKITLYYVNVIDIDDPLIDVESPYWDPENPATAKDLNNWFFHTMHHEFGHILQQKKNYPTDFNLISIADYRAGDWVNLSGDDAPKFGFVSGYASKEANEDFVEVLAAYVTHSQKGWQSILDLATDDGRTKILAKLEIVRDYMKGSWQIDIDKLRDIFLRRAAEVPSLDLRTLN